MTILRKVLLKASIGLFSVFLVLTFFVNLGVRYFIEVERLEDDAEIIFWQIDQVIQSNNDNIDDIIQDFSQQCLSNAMTAAYIAQYNPGVYDNLDDLKNVAELLGVDEIHFFNSEGVIYAGTHPEYYGFTFDSGEQIKFFAPMLEDKTLQLCQDILPNTAEGKAMQYAAVWNESGTEIVQIGVTPNRVLEAQEGTSISEVFSLMPISYGQIYLALDKETYEVVGSTNVDLLGISATDFGISEREIINSTLNLTLTNNYYLINGQKHLYLAHETDSYIIINLYDTSQILQSVSTDSILTAIYIIIFSIFATGFVMIYLNRKIIKSIVTINQKLEYIEQGNLNIVFTEDTVPEVKSLSEHINSMLKSLLNQTEKLSIALDLAQIPTGIIEYNTITKEITATSKVRDILRMSASEFNNAFSDVNILSEKIDEITSQNTMVDKNIFHLKDTQTYIKLEQFQHSDNVLILVMDISVEILEKEAIKHERDTDVLTGLYNRRAFYAKSTEMFNATNSPYVAVCMIDIDNLKTVNDVHGHEVGDLYIKSIANLINFDCDFISGRLGGDEFAVLLYNFTEKQNLIDEINKFKLVQDAKSINIASGDQITLTFSFGYAILPDDDSNYENLIKIADERMYSDKCARKGGEENIRHRK